jgi:DNA transformation protein
MDEEAIRDIFREVGPIRLRRMFGGLGIYHDDLMFALGSGGELYLKADDTSVALFRNLGSRPFTFQGRNGKPMATSYWLMPESALDDAEEAARLADLAIAAATRVKARKAGRKS